MIRCLFCLFMFILATTNAHAGTSGNELLLGELDQLLKERITYVRKKENKINYLKQLSSSEASVDKKYDIISRLIEEYSNFQSDSAFQYIEQNRLPGAWKAKINCWRIDFSISSCVRKQDSSMKPSMLCWNWKISIRI